MLGSTFAHLLVLVWVAQHLLLCKSIICQPQDPLMLYDDSIEGPLLRADPSQREDVMIRLFEQQDIVEVMEMVGHGDGLDDERLVHVFGEETPRIMTEGDKLRLKKSGYSFMDITDQPNLGHLNARRVNVFKHDLPSVGSSLQTTSFIREMIDKLDDKHLRADITKLSSFWNRNYRSGWGLLSSNWIYNHVQGILSTSQDNIYTSVSKFSHKFPQNTIIARIESAHSDVANKKLILISAHQDSLNYALPFYRAPGADDDGSGSVTILQVLRSLIEGGFVPPPHIAVEFHWFAAEEGGLLGSQDVAAAYEEADKDIKGILHMDMTAFVKNGTEPIIGLFETNVDANLTAFTSRVVDEYLPLKWNMTQCGKLCGSDHMSFTKAGYPAAFATESLFENGPFDSIHTAKDDTDQGGQYSFEHMLQFVKLGIAFAVELAAD